MVFKSKVFFFILSIFISLSLFYIGQSYLSSDMIAYVFGIFSIGIIPLILYFIWPKLNKTIFSLLITICMFLVIKAFLIIDKNLFNNFFIEHHFDLIGVFIGSIIITFLLIIALSFPRRRESSNSSTVSPTRSGMTKKILNLFLYLLTFILIFFLIYNPKYKYSLEKLSLFGYESFHEYHHATYFLGPIHEILSGKSLLINVSSFYGILSTYFNSLIFRVFKLTYPNFVLYTTLVAITYSAIIFLILKKVTKNFWLSIFGVLAFIRLTFFRDFGPETEVFIFPSTTPIRYFFDVIIFYMIFIHFQRSFSIKRLIFLSMLVVFFFFYSFDYGFFTLIAYIATLIFDVCLRFLNKEKISSILTKINQYFFSLIGAFISISVLLLGFTFFRSGSLPNFNTYSAFLSFMTGQLKARTFPSVIGWQHLPLVIFIIGFYFVFYQTLVKKSKNNHGFIFALVLGLLNFTYYVNMSEPSHLFPFLLPSIIVFVLLLKEYLNNLNKNISLTLIFSTVVFFFGVFWAIFMYPKPFTNLITERIKYRYLPIIDNYYYWNYPGTKFYLQDDDGKNFELAVNKIKKYALNEKEVVIISRYSALLHLMSGKSSLINHPNIESDVYSDQDYFDTLTLFKKLRPKYIFVHSINYNQSYFSGMDKFWDVIKKDYVFKEPAGAVDVYELK